MTSTLEAVGFWILGPLALAGALGMLFARNAVHSALWLVLTMLSLGLLYLVQDAPFLGIAQIIVYTGAIMMLFLFVLMLAGRDSSDSVVEVLRGQRVWAALFGIGLAGLIVAGVLHTMTDIPAKGLENPSANGPTGPGNVVNIGRTVFTTYLFPFELTSGLLITAAIGAMVLAFTRRHAKSGKPTQRELVNLRFRGEYERPSALPGPGVFATADSVATPALLPDGSISRESLSRIIATTPVSEIDEGTETTADPHALTGTAARMPEQPANGASAKTTDTGKGQAPSGSGEDDGAAADDEQEGSQV